MSRDTVQIRKLEALRDEIISRLPAASLFPSIGKVRGFLGTSPVMFVAERPSTAGEFSGPGKSLLYPVLEETGCGNAHLTDLIKTRGRVAEPYPEDIATHRDFFDREIEIVCPRLIVAFGQKVYDLLQFALAGRGIKVHQVWHYSYAARWGKQATFKAQLRDVVGNEA
jgi:uracil-DNA glycosylase